MDIINRRNVDTRAHDALLFTTCKPNNKKNEQNVYHRGAIGRNSLPVLKFYFSFACLLAHIPSETEFALGKVCVPNLGKE